jgi:hypothetical protein
MRSGVCKIITSNRRRQPLKIGSFQRFSQMKKLRKLPNLFNLRAYIYQAILHIQIKDLPLPKK